MLNRKTMNITEESKGLEDLLKKAEQQDIENPVEQGENCEIGCENCGS